MLSVYDPAPRRPTTRAERWMMGLFTLVLVGLTIAELLSGHDPRKLSVVFVVLFWYPLIVLHELGHALCARFLGFHVHEMVLGLGPELSRFRALGTEVVVRLLPAGGYVLPSPDRVAAARSRSALIYLAGPAIELAAATLVVALIGPEAFFQRTMEWPLLAAQSFVLAAVMGAVTNLIPSTLAGSASDGLGMWRSLWASDALFAYQMVHPHMRRAQQQLQAGAVEHALATVDGALSRMPEDPFLLTMRARCLAGAGDSAGAMALLETLRARPGYSDLLEAERLHAAADVALRGEDDSLWPEAERACRAALERVSQAPEYLITYAALLLQRGRAEEAYMHLQQAYKHTREPHQEDRCLFYLHQVAKRLGREEEAERYRAALPGRAKDV